MTDRGKEIVEVEKVEEAEKVAMDAETVENSIGTKSKTLHCTLQMLQKELYQISLSGKSLYIVRRKI